MGNKSLKKLALKKPVYMILVDWACEFITEYQTIKNQVFLIHSKNSYQGIDTRIMF